MNRMLKTLGLALVAMLATSALAAQTASATGELFNSTVEPTTIDASSVGTQDFETVFGLFECKQVSLNATLAKKAVSEFKAVPTYSECTGPGGKGPTRVTQTSCFYVFTSSIPSGKTHAPFHLECTTAGDGIDIEIEILGKWRPCIFIPAQTPGTGVTYANNGKHIDATLTLTNIQYTETGTCGSETRTTGTYQGKITLKGTDANKNEATLSWK